MKSAISILILTLLLIPTVNAKDSKLKKIKQAIQKNAADIAENTETINTNTEAIADIQVQSGKRRLFVHIEGHGNIGELIFGTADDAGIETSEHILTGNEGDLYITNVEYLDDTCSQPILRGYWAKYRMLGKPHIVALEQFTGQLYSVSSNADRHVIQENFVLLAHDPLTGEYFDTPQCISNNNLLDNEAVYYTLEPTNAPDFLSKETTVSNGIESTSYDFAGETTLQFD